MSKKIIKNLIDTDLEIAALGILSILFLEGLALFKGVDGTMFGASMVGIGGIVGWVFKGITKKIKK